MTKIFFRSVLTFFVAIILIGPAAHGNSQGAIREEGEKAARAFTQTALALVGKNKEEVITAIGMPDTTANADKFECWRYRKLFGEYRRSKLIFGHVSQSLEVRLELVFKDGVVISAKPSDIKEVHRNSGEITQ